MSFETALTGLKAATADLDVTSNNIANSATVGFKYSRAEFADIFATSGLGIASNAIGQGVRLANVAQQFTQGQFDFTGNSLDLAVNGSGFFRMSNDGALSYTRAGTFQLDREGFIIDADGRNLTGYQAAADGTITGALSPLKINTGNVTPRATSTLDITANLDAGASPVAVAFDPTVPASYNFSTSTAVYDEQGTSHLAMLYFRKTAANTWDVYVDGGAGTSVAPDATLTFADNGNITGTPSATFNIAGAGAPAVNVDFSSLTQYGSPFEVWELAQNGYSAGQFTGLGVESDGRLVARYTNGQSQVLGQVALTRFPSPQNLQPTGDTSWIQTFASGDALTGAPGSSGLGGLKAGALEQSNVNLTEQLVAMITAQRNFQANSQMISTQDQITQEILNIR